jgi:hypothetical protein
LWFQEISTEKVFIRSYGWSGDRGTRDDELRRPYRIRGRLGQQLRTAGLALLQLQRSRAASASEIAFCVMHTPMLMVVTRSSL